jgi:hypothetical protein
MRDKLKFKKLLNEFRSLKFEGEYIEDILLEAHEEFDKYYGQFCEDRGIKEESVKDYYMKLHGNQEELTQFKKTHRKLMRQLHPDKLDESDPLREEKEEDFKRVVEAVETGMWADFFDVADKYGVEIEEIDEANRLLMEGIEKIEGKNKGKKTTFSWMLSECEDEPCRERIIRTFLNFMYGYTGE